MALTRAYGWDAPEVGDVAPELTFAKDEFRIGMIGIGGMGRFALHDLLRRPHVRIAALCDVDEKHLGDAAECVNDAYGDDSCERYHDFRELNANADVDAVVICSPDHWHALHAIDAMRQGRDCYVEKPLTLTVQEGRRLCDVVAATGRICQTGSQQRSSREFRYACELVRNGYLGDMREIRLSIPPISRQCEHANGNTPVPAGFDYDFWLGPAAQKPYHPSRCHYSFRFISDYSGGQMTNWGAHMLDVVQWALDMDDAGPERVAGTCRFCDDGIFDTADDLNITWDYPGGVSVRCTTGIPRCQFIGSEGSLHVGRGEIECSDASLRHVVFKPDDVRLYRSDDHFDNFLASVRSRETPICPAEVGHRAATVCHIGIIALRLGRPLQWDAKTERFIDDAEANTMLSRPLRSPWTLD